MERNGSSPAKQRYKKFFISVRKKNYTRPQKIFVNLSCKDEWVTAVSYWKFDLHRRGIVRTKKVHIFH